MNNGIDLRATLANPNNSLSRTAHPKFKRAMANNAVAGMLRSADRKVDRSKVERAAAKAAYDKAVPIYEKALKVYEKALNKASCFRPGLANKAADALVAAMLTDSPQRREWRAAKAEFQKARTKFRRIERKAEAMGVV